jgi:hypothetical protein
MLTKTPGIIMDNDATGTFERNICGISLLTLRSIGFAMSVTRMIGITWSKSKCYIKTALGVSESFYQSSEEKQTFGLGQGSTAATDMWCIINVLSMHTVAAYFIGIIPISVSGMIQHKRIGEGLIDDTRLAASAQSSIEMTPLRHKQFTPDESSLFVKMQKILQFFLELLQVAGVDLNIAKFACFTVFHWWSGDKATMFKIHDSHPLMTMIHPYSGELKTVTKKDPSEAHRDLGWMMMKDCNSTAQLLVLKQKAKLFAGAILQSQMQRYDATTTYNCYYLASISYIIAATCLSLQQCKTIQSPIICNTLNKMDIHRNVARAAIVFGSKRLGGMVLCHLHTFKGILRIQYFIGQISNNNGVGKLMRICIETTQLEVGTFEPFLFTLYSMYGPDTLTVSWVLGIWSFVEIFKARINLTNSWLPSPQRHHNKASNSPHLPPRRTPTNK